MGVCRYSTASAVVVGRRAPARARSGGLARALLLVHCARASEFRPCACFAHLSATQGAKVGSAVCVSRLVTHWTTPDSLGLTAPEGWSERRSPACMGLAAKLRVFADHKRLTTGCPLGSRERCPARSADPHPPGSSVRAGRFSAYRSYLAGSSSASKLAGSLPRPDPGRIRSARDDQFSGGNRLFTALADRDRVKLGPAGVGHHDGRVPRVEVSITPLLECQKGGP
jgi:hypothetical protein